MLSTMLDQNNDKILGVTVKVLRLSGVISKTRTSKDKLLQRTTNEDGHPSGARKDSAIVVASFSRRVSTSHQSFLTHVPSLPVDLHPSDSVDDYTSHVIEWPSTGADDHNNEDNDEQPLSTFQFKQRFIREKSDTCNTGEKDEVRFVPTTCTLNLSISNDGKLLPMGKATVVISGEEKGESSIAIPITADGQATKYSAPLEKLRTKNKDPEILMMKDKGSAFKFGVKSDAMLRVLVAVSDPDSTTVPKKESPRKDYPNLPFSTVGSFALTAKDRKDFIQSCSERSDFLRQQLSMERQHHDEQSQIALKQKSQETPAIKVSSADIYGHETEDEEDTSKRKCVSPGSSRRRSLSESDVFSVKECPSSPQRVSMANMQQHTLPVEAGMSPGQMRLLQLACSAGMDPTNFRVPRTVDPVGGTCSGEKVVFNEQPNLTNSNQETCGAAGVNTPFHEPKQVLDRSALNDPSLCPEMDRRTLGLEGADGGEENGLTPQTTAVFGDLDSSERSEPLKSILRSSSYGSEVRPRNASDSSIFGGSTSFTLVTQLSSTGSKIKGILTKKHKKAPLSKRSSSQKNLCVKSLDGGNIESDSMVSGRKLPKYREPSVHPESNDMAKKPLVRFREDVKCPSLCSSVCSSSEAIDTSFSEGGVFIPLEVPLETGIDNTNYLCTENENSPKVCDLPWHGIRYTASDIGNSEEIMGLYTGPVDDFLMPHGEGCIALHGSPVRFRGSWKNGSLVSNLANDCDSMQCHVKENTVNNIVSEREVGQVLPASFENVADTTKENLPQNRPVVGDNIISTSCSFEPPMLPSYNLGEVARTPKDMIIHRSKEVAAHSASLLKTNDQAFIRRTNGLWTCAILAERSLQPINKTGDNSTRWLTEAEIGGLPDAELEECMLFVINEDGATKTIPKQSWGKFIRRVKPAEEEEPQIETYSHGHLIYI